MPKLVDYQAHYQNKKYLTVEAVNKIIPLIEKAERYVPDIANEYKIIFKLQQLANSNKEELTKLIAECIDIVNENKSKCKKLKRKKKQKSESDYAGSEDLNSKKTNDTSNAGYENSEDFKRHVNKNSVESNYALEEEIVKEESETSIEKNILGSSILDAGQQVLLISKIISERNEIVKLRIESETEIKRLENKIELSREETKRESIKLEQIKEKNNNPDIVRLEILNREIELEAMKQQNGKQYGIINIAKSNKKE